MGECSPRDDATHAVSDKIDDNILLLVFLHIVTDIVFNFFCYLLAHDSDVSLGVVLVWLGDEEICVWDLLHYPSFDQVHVVGRALETVAEDYEHVLLGVLEFAAFGGDLLLGLRDR